MENVLTWGLLLKALAAWIGVYFIQPLLFIARDYAVDWYVKKYILTEELFIRIQMRANDVWEINKRGTQVQVRSTSEGTAYYLGEKEVTAKQWENYTKTMDFHYKREAECAKLIGARQLRLERLFQHYKQDAKNPIPKWEKVAYERVERSRNAKVQAGSDVG